MTRWMIRDDIRLLVLWLVPTAMSVLVHKVPYLASTQDGKVEVRVTRESESESEGGGVGMTDMDSPLV